MRTSTKSELLKQLEDSGGAFVSGGTLAALLGISRAAVWKAAEDLRAEGYGIEAATRKGYRLTAGSDRLSLHGIAPYLDSSLAGRIHIFDAVDSTNLTAREMLLSGAPPGTVILAEEQRRGRGRLGRDFFSPRTDSLYCSFILTPPAGFREAQMVTVAASVAVCWAAEKWTGCQCEIKWVNDIFVGGKKICGILTEASADLEGGGVESLILGVGVNINMGEADFPEALRAAAGALSLPPGLRCRFAAELIRQVFAFCDGAGQPCIDEYRARSCVVGKNIYVIQGDQKKEAEAVGINDSGNLLVRYPDGRTETLYAGEISIRVR
ncbi:MAG: biotin--[acetyl-CoA-carboxylase] ligase [Clostridiales Family XIII bacterium]|jgi:BirA family biotin operon repressor/biotin-[acetyl-CoA-carboxylase] ligase|nr:biotin--[acetyl-CoA-carboxylase] ligase [Clostridiales Family XIII bacterium]